MARVVIDDQDRSICEITHVHNSDTDDWDYIYINGKLAAEGHEIRIQDLCEVLGIKYKYAEQPWGEDDAPKEYPNA